MNVKILFDCNWNVHGRAQHFDAGSIVDLDANTAAELIEALMAEPADAPQPQTAAQDKPARKPRAKAGGHGNW